MEPVYGFSRTGTTGYQRHRGCLVALDGITMADEQMCLTATCPIELTVVAQLCATSFKQIIPPVVAKKPKLQPRESRSPGTIMRKRYVSEAEPE